MTRNVQERHPKLPLGVYIHFPWCRRRCPYCDFAIAVAPLAAIPHDAYADAVIRELKARAPLFLGDDHELVSIYLGGGTPALWHASSVARVLAHVRAYLGAGDDLEITVEANPNDCVPETLDALRAAGVNRLSIGTQAFDDAALVFLGRDHSARDSLAAVAVARAAGFAHVSVDLIYALPGRDGAAWPATLARALAENPEHLSVYELTVEKRTTLGARRRRGELMPVDDEVAAREHERAHDVLTAAGFAHYEVSSYARPEREARHNSLYWHGGAYLGLGAAAHSFLPRGAGAVRWSTHRSVVRYFREVGRVGARLEGDALVAELEHLDAEKRRAEALWLGLRTRKGVPAEWLAARAPVLANLLAAGLLAQSGDRIHPTSRGLLMADEIAVLLLK